MLKVTSTLDVPAVRFGEEEAIRLLARTGYDCCDWTMYNYADPRGFFGKTDWRKRAAGLKKISQENNIPFAQAHAPFPSNNPANPEKDSKIFEYLLLSLEACSIVECPYIIIHPVDTYPSAQDPDMREEAYRMNIDFYGRLIPRAKELGVKIALENMFGHSPEYKRIVPRGFSTAEEMAKCIDELGGDTMVACLDVGHSVLVNDTMHHMARVLGSRLQTLHIHSNDGVRDCHTAPLVFPMEWEKFGKALKDINYSGTICLEADGFLDPLPDNMIEIGEKYLCASARYIASLAE